MQIDRSLGTSHPAQRLRITARALLSAASLLASTAALPCWEDAARHHGVSSALLVAIARTESALNPAAIGRNANGSRDIGLMQINSAWLPTLSRHGIGESDLLDPCTNIHVGAWILAANFRRLGHTWEAVGAYNAASRSARDRYIARIRRALGQP